MREHCCLSTAVCWLEPVLFRGVSAYQLTQKSTTYRSLPGRTKPLLDLCIQFSSSCHLQRQHGVSELIFAGASTAPQAAETSQHYIPGNESSWRQQLCKVATTSAHTGIRFPWNKLYLNTEKYLIFLKTQSKALGFAAAGFIAQKASFSLSEGPF